MFTKGQSITFKKRGADASLKQYAGQSAIIVRGVSNVLANRNVTLSQSVYGMDGESITNTFRVPASVLAVSILKN